MNTPNLCPKCTTERLERVIKVVRSKCWKCHEDMLIAFGFEEEVQELTPEVFTSEELEATRGAGANLKEKYSKTEGRSYMANVCPKCDSLTGSFFLHDHWLPVEHGLVSADVACRTWRCPECSPTEDEIAEELEWQEEDEGR